MRVTFQAGAEEEQPIGRFIEAGIKLLNGNVSGRPGSRLFADFYDVSFRVVEPTLAVALERYSAFR